MQIHILFGEEDLTKRLASIDARLERIETKMAAIDEQVEALSVQLNAFEDLTTQLGEDVLAEIAKLTQANPLLASSMDRLTAIGEALKTVDAAAVEAMNANPVVP